MTSWMWAILLRPIVLPIFFFLVVAPIAWLLYRLFPDGRLKVALFRDRTGLDATRRDKWMWPLTVLGAYAALVAWLVIRHYLDIRLI